MGAGRITFHSALSCVLVCSLPGVGFPIIRFPPVSSSPSVGSGAGGGGDGDGGDEDSDDSLPEAKDLLRDLGAGAD